MSRKYGIFEEIMKEEPNIVFHKGGTLECDDANSDKVHIYIEVMKINLYC